MKSFHWLILWLAGLARDAVGRLLSAEIRLGTAMAREEFFAQAELQAAEFERTNRPELAAAIRVEIARLKNEDALSSGGGPVASAVAPPSPEPQLAEAPTDDKPATRRGAKKALPQSPSSADPYAPPPGPPWFK